MSETPSPQRSQNPDALREYQTGLDQKTQGNFDGALTSFRRAVIADPNFGDAHFQIGLICKEKAKRDKMFLRYTFDAFRSASRLDPANAQAHDQYILAAQQTGQLETLHGEYETLSKGNPDNELFKRLFKNIMTLELAMIPQRVEVGSAKASGTMRRFTLFIALGMILVGLALVFLPAMFKKGDQAGTMQWSGVMKAGIAMIFVGFGGVFAFTQMK